MSRRWTDEDKQWQEYRRQSTLMKVNLPKAPWEDDNEAGSIERSNQADTKEDRRFRMGDAR